MSKSEPPGPPWFALLWDLDQARRKIALLETDNLALRVENQRLRHELSALQQERSVLDAVETPEGRTP